MLSSYAFPDADLSFPLSDLSSLNQPLLPPALAQAFAIPLPDVPGQDAPGNNNPAPQRDGSAHASVAAATMHQQPSQPTQPSLPQAPFNTVQQPQQQGFSAGQFGGAGTGCGLMHQPPAAAPQPPGGMGFSGAAGNPYAFSQGMCQFPGMPGMGMQNLAPAYPAFPYGALPHQGFSYGLQDPSMFAYPPFAGFPPAAMFHGYGDFRSPLMPAVQPKEEGGTREGDVSEETAARALKRPRLVWTPQLHKCFVNAVDELGVDKAVPKTIMQRMNVDGLTRENVASHLQKYRLQLKRDEPDERGGGARSKGGTAKKKRRVLGSAFEDSRGGSPRHHAATEGLGSTDKSPQGERSGEGNETPSHLGDASCEVMGGAARGGNAARGSGGLFVNGDGSGSAGRSSGGGAVQDKDCVSRSGSGTKGGSARDGASCGRGGGGRGGHGNDNHSQPGNSAAVEASRGRGSQH